MFDQGLFNWKSGSMALLVYYNQWKINHRCLIMNHV